MSESVYTVFFPFCGAGPGARGFLDAQLQLLGKRARFRSLGGIDFDAAACADFEYLTESRALCADISTLTAAELVAFAGEAAPHVVFMSPPCKGASGLLSEEKSKSEKYSQMNDLALAWTRLMLAAWGDDPPSLVLLENVPRLKKRAAKMLREIRRLLRAAGYVLTDGYHDCGELGGLAQRRRRFLLVARHAKKVPPLLYQPIRRRVRACGEVLGPMPMPGDAAGGPMHALPRISWLNWVRLALIPAGGDWRDLPGVLEDGQPRRSKFKRHRMERWEAPVGTIGGSGSNGVGNVADPRPGVALAPSEARHWNKYAVTPWEEPARTVIGAVQPGSGGPSVADPRVDPVLAPRTGYAHSYAVKGWEEPAGAVTSSGHPSSGAASVADPRVGLNLGPDTHHNVYAVADWNEPAGTVTGATRPGAGAASVADPRARNWGGGDLGVIPFDAPAGTIAGESWPRNGAFSVQDPRVKRAFDTGYRVVPWDQPVNVVAGKSHPGNGAFSVADPRMIALGCKPREGTYGVIPWEEAAKTVTGTARIDNGRFAVADPRLPADAPPVMVIHDVKRPPSGVPVIVAKDGTWHRPLTTLELAALQGIPTVWKGKPLKLSGDSSSAWRERIGNAVPPPASRAIAERMLASLLQATHETFVLSGDSDVWVQPVDDEGAEIVGMM